MPCSCGAREKCPTIAPKQPAHVVNDAHDPAEHFAMFGGYQALAALYGPATALKLFNAATLWSRDGPGSRWSKEYWHYWESRKVNI